MKKKYLFIIIISVILLFMGITYCIYMLESRKVGSFNLTEYEDMISMFPSKIVFGYTNSAEKAKENAEEVWIEIYGNSVKENKPYIVDFDEKNQVWLVYGTLHGNRDGGTANILIQKYDGKVLAVWHYK